MALVLIMGNDEFAAFGNPGYKSYELYIQKFDYEGNCGWERIPISDIDSYSVYQENLIYVIGEDNIYK